MNRLDAFTLLAYPAYSCASITEMNRFIDGVAKDVRRALQQVEIIDTQKRTVRTYLTHRYLHAPWLRIEKLLERMRSGDCATWLENHRLGIPLPETEGVFPVILIGEGVYTFSFPRPLPREKAPLEETLVGFLESGEKECVIVWEHRGIERRAKRRTSLSTIPGKRVRATQAARGVLYFREKKVDSTGAPVGWLTAILLIELSLLRGKKHKFDSIAARFRCLSKYSADPEKPIGPSSRGLDATWKRLIKRAKAHFRKKCEPVARSRMEWLQNTKEFYREYEKYKKNRDIPIGLLETLRDHEITPLNRMRQSLSILLGKAVRLLDPEPPDYRAHIQKLHGESAIREALATVNAPWRLLVFVDEFIWSYNRHRTDLQMSTSAILEEIFAAYEPKAERRALLMAMAQIMIAPLDTFWD